LLDHPSNYHQSSYLYSHFITLVILVVLVVTIPIRMAKETDPLVPIKTSNESTNVAPLATRLRDVVRMYWHLGLIAFGGPSAHVAILRDHLCIRNHWMDEDAFMELFALCVGLPGPTSTQLVISTAVTHAGPLGGMIAYVFWNLPGFLVLTLSGLFLYNFIDPANPPIWLIGVPAAAVSLVFKAFYGFGMKLDKLGIALSMISCAVAVMINGDEHIPRNSSQFVYPLLLVCGGMCTMVDFLRGPDKAMGEYTRSASGVRVKSESDRMLQLKIGMPLWVGAMTLLFWLFLFAGSITLVSLGYDNAYLKIFEVMFRTGSLVFGGAEVALPMLQNEIVPLGWVTDEQFFQGLGLAQSLPGPLFNFSSFLGATYKGVLGAIVAEIGLFGPGYILIFAMMPFWGHLRHSDKFKAILKGINAAAIGLLGSGCIYLYARAVKTAADAMVFVLAGGLGGFFGMQAPFVILFGALAGGLFSHGILNVGQVKYH